MPSPESVTTILRLVRRPLEAHVDAAPLGRELDAVREQVPHDLLQPRRIADDARAGPRRRRSRGARASRRPPGGRSRSASRTTSASSTGWGCSRKLPLTMRDTSRMSSMRRAWVSPERCRTSRPRPPARGRSSPAAGAPPSSSSTRAACAARATPSPGTRPSAGSPPAPRRRGARCRPRAPPGARGPRRGRGRRARSAGRIPRRGERQRAERPPARRDGDDHRRAVGEAAERGEVLLVRGDLRERLLGHVA